MDIPRLLIVCSTLAFLGGVVHAMVALRAGQWRENRWHLVPMAAGFIFQSVFLYLRGQQHGRCPLTNHFEAFIFIGWCIVLLYFLVGATYRLSLLGVFTAPLIAFLQIVSLIRAGTWDLMTDPKGPVTIAGELHKTVALIAYAAFALACITGVMFLLQDRLLKKRRINALFHQLPPINDLSKAIVRMVFFGVVLLSLAMSTTFSINKPITSGKMLAAWIVLALYIIIALLMWRRSLSARQTAWLAVLGFLVPLLSMWFVTGKI